MKRIILCEGKTDAILISYFLERKFGWSYTEKSIISLPVDRKNEVLNWYTHPEKPNQELAIWGTGGIDQLPVKLGSVLDRTRNERDPINRFDYIVVFFDSDQRDEGECREMVQKWATTSDLNITGDLQLGQWIDATIDLRKRPPEAYQLRILSIVLPPGGKGTLETFLVDALRNSSDHDRQLVDEARRFIGDLPDKPYLERPRCRPKACLGAILSVMSPDWVFSELHQRLTNVRWEEIESVMSTYKQLEKL